MIFLFTDFGSADIYVGQVKAVLAKTAPSIPAIDLLNDVPKFQIAAGAHLLAALSRQLPSDSVTLAVVDPGVGTARRPIVLRCRGRWFVGPDNGLLSVLAARYPGSEIWEIVWRPQSVSRSFHGRDLFAPVAGRMAMGAVESGELERESGLQTELDSQDLPEVIYLDSYGNAFTGIRGSSIDESTVLEICGQRVRHAGVFAEAKGDSPFWHVNSIGLVELACNQASAAEKLRIEIGQPVTCSVP